MLSAEARVADTTGMDTKGRRATGFAVVYWAAATTLSIESARHGAPLVPLGQLTVLCSFAVASLFVGALVRGSTRAARRFLWLYGVIAVTLVGVPLVRAGLHGSVVGMQPLLACIAGVTGALAVRAGSTRQVVPATGLARGLISIALETVYGLAALVVALCGILLGLMRCDEGCRGDGDMATGGHWTDRRDAWQWDTILACSVTLLVVGLLFAATAASLRRSPLALIPYAIQLGASVAGLAVLATGWTAAQLSMPTLAIVGLQVLAGAIVVLRRSPMLGGLAQPQSF